MFEVSDWYSQSRAQLGKKRPLTYELSNFGNLKVLDSRQDPEDAVLKLERMLVSQCGSGQYFVFEAESMYNSSSPSVQALLISHEPLD